MKANRVARGQEDDRAEVGIGTLIVFIAAVLVAAVAAAVLITTQGQLQERSQVTGQETTRAVSSNLVLQSISATRPGSTGDMEHLNITVALGAGSYPVDLSNTTIIASTNTTSKYLSYVNGAGANDKFNATAIRDADSSFSTATPVVSSGDLVKIWINLNVNTLSLAPGETLHLRITPPTGAVLTADAAMPTTFGTDKVVTIR